MTWRLPLNLAFHRPCWTFPIENGTIGTTDSPMKRTMTAALASICAIPFLAGCGTNADGSRRTLTECWNAHVASQDAAARGFVDTSGDVYRDRNQPRPRTSSPDSVGGPL